MKVNLKKIGAIVAGATILASTAAFAGLYFGDTMLVDDNGAPTVKIVVGEQAAASDGVGGALAAGKIVGESYKTEELTAKITGTAKTDCGNGTATGGTCAISNEKAQLEITVPGGVAEGSYTINNLIGDYLNRRLEDRVDNIGGNTDAEYPIGGSDFSENSNPFTDGVGGNIGPSESFMFRVSGSMFSPFATSTITDDTAAKTYSEQQDAWVRGSSYYSDSDNDVVGDLRFLAYTLKFKGASDDFGIPVCTTPTGQDYTYCKSGAGDANFDYATETHKVKVQFLGEPWIISEMSPPTTVAATSETQVYPGGYVKLAKESVSGILNQGESLPVDDLKFHLDDLEAHGDVTSAIISVLDANDNILKKDKVLPGATKEFSIGGKIYRFHVYKVAPGYTFGAKWADVAIFAKELKVEDGQHLDPDYDDNEDWQAAVGWKNKGAQVGIDEQVDHLRTIVLYSDDIAALSSSGEARLEENDYLPIVEDPVAWKLTYAGLSITSSQRNSLKYQLERTSNYTLSSTKGPLANGSRVSCTIKAPYVKVSSSKSGSVFEATGDDGTGISTTLSDNQFYVATDTDWTLNPYGGFVCDDNLGACPNDMTYDGTYDVCYADTWGSPFDGSGAVFMRLSPTSQYYGYVLYDWSTPLSTVINYQTVGDGDTNWETGGVLELVYNNNPINALESYAGDDRGGTGQAFGLARLTVASGNVPDWFFAFSEKAGVDTSNNFADYALNGLYLGGGTPGDASFNFDSQTGASEYVTREDYTLYMYAGPVNTRGSVTTLEEGGITERGSVFSSIDDTSVTYYMANELARSQFVLATAGESASEALGTCIRTLAEGETSEPCNGVTVKVLQITEDVGACSASGGTGCTVNMDGVGAVIMPDNAASVTQVVPYANAYKDLVILDRDAVGVNTVVSIGGDKVNTVTAQLLQGSPVDWTTERVVVKEVVKGSKIVVAGAEADDTLEAVDNFISQLRRA